MKFSYLIIAEKKNHKTRNHFMALQ